MGADRTISIHAPRTGSDPQRSAGIRIPANFNPRSPHGERPALLRWRRWRRGFQPTLPARGATGAFCLAFLLFGISTHAPRTGSDVRRAINHHASAQFQSTLPARGATQHQHGHGGEKPISIHAPRTGSDWMGSSMGHVDPLFQSTLPARGATGKERRGRCTAGHFNPRSPHGERLNRNNTERLKQISIHAPRTGSDSGHAANAPEATDISIHAPRTGSDSGHAANAPEATDISIHAPRTGATANDGTIATATAFQSTLPARGATLKAEVASPLRAISIHAPRTGSDCRRSIASTVNVDFNPRSPHGERQPDAASTTNGSYFNPRSPHGERRRSI